jgi:hypothetical protein
MAYVRLHHDTATNNEIIAYCLNPNRLLLSGAAYGNKVIKLSDKAVVKFGIGVKEEEANNQRKAFNIYLVVCESTAIRRPKHVWPPSCTFYLDVTNSAT